MPDYQSLGNHCNELNPKVTAKRTIDTIPRSTTMISSSDITSGKETNLSKKRRRVKRTDSPVEPPSPPPPITLPDPFVDLSELSGKHISTLTDVFVDPVRADVAWRDIETLFVALGVEVTEGKGSRVRCAFRGVRAVFHRPHPEKETTKGAIRSVRRFLAEAGVKA